MAIAQIGDLPDMPRPDDLEEAVLRSLDEADGPPEVGGRWHIADVDNADWALRKLAKVRAEITSVNTSATRKLEAIQMAIAPWTEPIVEWQASQLEKLAKEEANWESLLMEFHKSVVAEDPKRLSIKRTYGTLASRKAQDTWTFDEAKFLAWATANAPELVRVKDPEVDKQLAKKTLVVADDGTVTMPGVEAAVEGVVVSVGERNYDVVTAEVAQ